MSVAIIQKKQNTGIVDIQRPTQEFLDTLKREQAPVLGKAWLRLSPDYHFTAHTNDQGETTVIWHKLELQ